MMRNNLFKQTALIFLSVLVWVCFLIYISINNWCVSFNDFYGFAHSPLKSFYLNSFWPSGYPLFIKFFSLFTEDILFVGKSISLISTLIMLFLILYKIAKLSFSSSGFTPFYSYPVIFIYLPIGNAQIPQLLFFYPWRDLPF